jgi:hypothetical protein
MPAPSPPKPEFWFLARFSGDCLVEQLKVDRPDAPGALAVYSSARSAHRHCEQALGPEWYPVSVDHERALAWLAEMRRRGASHVVLDPPPYGPGKVFTIFQALVEWQ